MRADRLSGNLESVCNECVRFESKNGGSVVERAKPYRLLPLDNGS
jgi:hypothetical protein